MGVSSDTGNSEMQAAMAGGSTFEQRLAELATAKQSLTDAYTNLGLGKNAKDAIVAAEASKAEAEALVANAKIEAKSIVQRANDDALKITATAKQSLNDYVNDERGKIEAQKAEAADLRSKAKAEREDAAKALADAREASAIAKAAQVAAEASNAAAAEAAAMHAAEAEKIKALREKVATALKEIDNV